MIGSEVNKRTSQFLGIDSQTLRSVYFKFNHLSNNGILPWSDVWKKVTDELGISDKHEALMKFMDQIPRHNINEQIILLIEKLKANGYKVGLLSNNDIRAAHRFRDTKLIDYFDAVVVSADVGCSKPDPKIFKIFIEKLGVIPGELIYIDDTERSLSTAKEVGYTPILFTNYDALLQDLSNLSIKV